MLARSRKSAFILAVVFTMTALIVAGTILTVRYLISTFSLDSGENVLSAGSNNVIEPIIAMLGLILIVGFGLVMLSLWIYSGDDSHFGSRGAIR